MLIALLVVLAAEGLGLVIIAISILYRIPSLQPSITIPVAKKPPPSREDITLAVFAALVAQKRPADENTLKQAQSIADGLFLSKMLPVVPVDGTPADVAISQ